MNPIALKGNVIVRYETPAEVEEHRGILRLSEKARRDLERGKNRILRVNEPPPDIVRAGVVVSTGTERCREGQRIYFNKHDADEFDHGNKIFYRVKEDFILAVYLGDF